MRILMLAHRIPYPPHTGDKVRAFHVARHLARHHEVTLAFLIDDAADEAGLEPLRHEIRDLEFARTWKPWGLVKGMAALAAGRSLTLAYFGSATLRERLRARLRAERYDLVYVSSSSVAQYVEGDLPVPIVMDYVDVDSDKWLQYARRSGPPLSWLYRLEGTRLRTYEADIARRARLSLLATPAEAALLSSFAPWARTAVMLNGVDLDYYAPRPRQGGPPTVIFTGAMDYRPNIDAVEYFCADVFPHVRRAVGDARFLIVGLNPARSVRALGEGPGVVVTGAVPDVRPYYAESDVCVAPLRITRGVQNKVLQAMAMGRPVVATSAACVGIDVRTGEELDIEDEPEAFAARVVALLRDPAHRDALGARGRRFVEAQHSWEASLGHLDQLIDTILGPRHGGDGARSESGRPRSTKGDSGAR